jgi:hypothetical protein
MLTSVGFSQTSICGQDAGEAMTDKTPTTAK